MPVILVLILPDHTNLLFTIVQVSIFSLPVQDLHYWNVLGFIHSQLIYRGSYMSAHVLLNLLNELGKRDKMRGLPSILSLFRNEFNKFNKTRALMLDYLSYNIKITMESHDRRKNVILLSFCTQRCYGRHNVSRKSIYH